MIVVPVKEGENIERAIKKFKRKFDKTGVIKELRRRQQFNKPSEIKREKMQHAIYVQQMHAHDDMYLSSFVKATRTRAEQIFRPRSCYDLLETFLAFRPLIRAIECCG